MANILVGDSEELANLQLAERLKLEHEVMYLTDAKSMLWELSPTQRCHNGRRYDLVLCDFNLFYPEAKLEKKLSLLENPVAGYLALGEAPVIIISENSLEATVQPVTRKLGLDYLGKPYSLEFALGLVRKNLKMG